MIVRSKKNILVFTFFFLGVFESAHSVDNPDQKKNATEFTKHAKKYEERVSELSGGGPGLVAALADYEKFLDGELNLIYNLILSKLSSKEKKLFQASQKKWILFRDAEFAFLKSNWTVKNFGTSSMLSLGQYRNTLVKDRVRALYNYHDNY